MSDKTNKQVYKFSSPNSSSKTSPKRTFAEVVSPVSTPTRKFANVSSSSKRKRHEKFQGSSKGISKFRKLSKPEPLFTDNNLTRATSAKPRLPVVVVLKPLKQLLTK